MLLIEMVPLLAGGFYVSTVLLVSFVFGLLVCSVAVMFWMYQLIRSLQKENMRLHHRLLELLEAQNGNRFMSVSARAD